MLPLKGRQSELHRVLGVPQASGDSRSVRDKRRAHCRSCGCIPLSVICFNRAQADSAQRSAAQGHTLRASSPPLPSTLDSTVRGGHRRQNGTPAAARGTPGRAGRRGRWVGPPWTAVHGSHRVLCAAGPFVRRAEALGGWRRWGLGQLGSVPSCALGPLFGPPKRVPVCGASMCPVCSGVWQGAGGLLRPWCRQRDGRKLLCLRVGLCRGQCGRCRCRARAEDA